MSRRYDNTVFVALGLQPTLRPSILENAESMLTHLKLNEDYAKQVLICDLGDGDGAYMMYTFVDQNEATLFQLGL